jgi:hypothetical protein
MPIAFGLDLSVNDHEAYVHALGSQLTSHALRERAQAELRNGQVGEAGAAAQRGSCAREDDRPMPSLDHAPGGRLPDEEPSEAADAPAALKVGGIDIENISLLEGARVEYDDVRCPEVMVDTIKDMENIFAIRNVGGIRPNAVAAFRLDQGIQLRFVASDCADLHVLGHEALCQRPAKAGSDPEDDRCLRPATGVPPPSFLPRFRLEQNPKDHYM